MDDVKSFKNLRTWQESQNLVDEIYRITASFPKEEIYGLTNQLRRAAVSIPSNIAEGMGRGTAKELVQFLIIARGSIHEVLSECETAFRQKFMDKFVFESVSHRYRGLNAGMNAHISSLVKYK